MLSSNGNSYLRPEYLNPPPTTTMDSKKSPLALLAQTCSQIGADPQIPAASGKNSSSAQNAERKKSVSESQRDKSSPLSVGGSSDSGSTTNNNRVQQPSSSSNSNNNDHQQSGKNCKKSSGSTESRLTPDRRSKSISPKNPNRNPSGSGGPSQSVTQSIESANLSSANGLMSHPSQQQQQHQQQHPLMMPGNDPSSAAMSLASYKSLMAAGMGSPYSAAAAAAAAAYPPYSTAGFGAGLPPGYPSHMDLGAYASALNAVAKSSMPFPSASSAAAMMSGYLAAQHPAYSAALAMQYGRMKNPSLFTAPATTPTDGATCRDPYCTGCPSSNNNNNSNPPGSGGAMHMICAAGCGLGVQCDHLKVPIPAHHLTAGPASSPLGPPSSPLNAANNKPYVCNWIVGDNYCGKRFGSSDDLLQHLRTHTNLSSAAVNEAAAAAAVAGLTNNSMPPTSSSAVHPSAAFAHPSSLMRAYPTPPLSPLSAARYHPYGKNPAAGQQQHPAVSPQQQQSQGPPGFPPGLFHPHHPALVGMAGSSPYPPPGLFHHPALAPYYSHLSLFAPRGLGSAPLPP